MDYESRIIRLDCGKLLQGIILHFLETIAEENHMNIFEMCYNNTFEMCCNNTFEMC